VPLIAQNKLAVVDLAARKMLGEVSTGGIAPFGVALSRDGNIAYVSNWGGRVPKSGDLSAPTGLAADADRVAVDAAAWPPRDGRAYRFDVDGGHPHDFG